MAVAVQLHAVAGGNDLSDKRRPPHHLLTGEEEGRRRPPLAQNLEHRGGPLRVRPVVEGQGNAVPLALLHLNPKGRTQPRDDRCQRRAGVQYRGRRGAGPQSSDQFPLLAFACLLAVGAGCAGLEFSTAEVGVSVSLPKWMRPSSGFATTL